MVRRIVLTVVVAAVLVAGCGDDAGDDPAPDPTAAPGGTSVDVTGSPGSSSAPPPPVDTAPPPSDEEAAVLEAVDCYWRTIVEANDPPDPDHPGFDRCFTGAALERSRGRVEQKIREGEYVDDATGVERFDTVVLIEGPSTATVAQCFVDDAVVRLVADDSVVDDSVRSYDVEFKLTLNSNRWLVTDTIAVAERESRSCG